MSIPLAPLSSLTTTAQALSGLILVSPQDIGYVPESGTEPSFYFDYEGEQSTLLEADATDHYIEDNTAIQDQVALRPKIFSTHGFVGELNNVVPKILGVNQSVAQDKLTLIAAYAPALSVAALLAYNQAAQAYEIVQSASRAVASWGNVEQSKQALAYQKFAGYFSLRTLFKIQTPWETLENMVIISLRAVQDAETRMITDFQMSFKQLKFTTSAITDQILTGRAADQSIASSPVNLGTTNLQALTTNPVIAGVQL